ncbi:MAG: DUF4293 domain-containing protein [Bacteroidales bacterium]|nr:DUF4293 domain-containing protein [Bacteroidales bacterium]MDE7128144.1 DUF4293 domain-containing protein [Bacteroidales bacterium]
MWQRIQTLYLAIASILVGSLFFARMATVLGPDGASIDIRYYEKLPFLLFLISLFSANVIGLLTFRARLLQMRVCILAALLLVGFQIWIGADFFRYKDSMIFSFTAVFPIVAAILDVLAARAIALDEAMVQSAARLRGKRKRK